MLRHKRVLVAVLVAVLVVSLACLSQSLQGLFLALLIPVLLVVAICVGHKRRRRFETEERLRRELDGVSRSHALLSALATDDEPSSILTVTLNTARSILSSPRIAFWWTRTGEDWHLAASPGFPEGVAARWTLPRCPKSPLASAAEGREVSLSCESDPTDALREDSIEAAFLAPFEDHVGGCRGCLVATWKTPKRPTRLEKEAVRDLARQAAACLESGALLRLLSRTRDVWQDAFAAIPSPVVVVDHDAHIVQANPAFTALGDFDDPDGVIGSSFTEVLEGAFRADGKLVDGVRRNPISTARWIIPHLRGEFDVTRSPYLGETEAAPATVWVLRPIWAV